MLAGIPRPGPWRRPPDARSRRSGGENGCVSDTCIFCRIVTGSAPAYIVAEDELTVAFLDRGRATEGHTLVVPRSHAIDIWDVAESEAVAVMATAQRVARLLDERP